MNGSRTLPAVSAVIALLMAAVAAAMSSRASSTIQVKSAVLCLGVALIALALVPGGRLLRWLRTPALHPGLRIVGGVLCLAAAAIATRTEPAPVLSFPFLNALWIVLLGCLLTVSALADWLARGEGRP